MPEHLIRLRGGWLCAAYEGLPDRDAPAAAPGPSVTLPVVWPEQAGAQAMVRLVRAFTAPPWNPGHERLSLRLSAVGGLVAVALNGQVLARPAPATTELELPLCGPLPRRNRLVLDVRLADALAARAFPGQAWGVIALVIRGDESLGEDAPPA